jgi:hypothetical protein
MNIAQNVLREDRTMYRVSFSKRIFGLPFTIASVEVRAARSPERALRAAELKFRRLLGLPDWRMRADAAEIEPPGSMRESGPARG